MLNDKAVSEVSVPVPHPVLRIAFNGCERGDEETAAVVVDITVVADGDSIDRILLPVSVFAPGLGINFLLVPKLRRKRGQSLVSPPSRDRECVQRSLHLQLPLKKAAVSRTMSQ